MNLKYKIHEWAADRFSFVQYPQARRAHRAKTKPKLSFVDRGLLLVIGLGLGLVGLVAVAVGTFMLYVIVTSF